MGREYPAVLGHLDDDGKLREDGKAKRLVVGYKAILGENATLPRWLRAK
jgi:hypothetical protein